ncbi:hypothetical protein Leryth_020447, partial [Lithospermum erythrorhizon]
MDTSASPTSSAQLAVAALFGASVMAISAFFIHKRSVSQVLDRLLNLRHHHHPRHVIVTTTTNNNNNNNNLYDDDDDDDYYYRNELINSFDKQSRSIIDEEEEEEDEVGDDMFGRFVTSSSLPNVRILSRGESESEKVLGNGENRGVLSRSLDNTMNLIPSGLSKLRTVQRDGQHLLVRPGSRSLTPRSSKAYGAGDSDIDEAELETDQDLSLADDNELNGDVQNHTVQISKDGKDNFVQVQHKSIPNEIKAYNHAGDRKTDVVPVPILGNNGLYRTA